MEDEKFTPVGGGEEPEKKGFKVKVITLLIIFLIIVVGILVARSMIQNNKKKTDEKLASATVVYELNRIKSGDEEALEKYLSYSDLLINQNEIDEDIEIDEENENDDKNTIEDNEADIEVDEENENDDKNTIEDTETETENTNDSAEIEDEIDETEIIDEESDDDYIFKMFLNTLNFEITNVNVENSNATVTAKISNKNSGEIFRNYFTRAIKLAINQALSKTKSDNGKSQKELQEYLEEQVNSSEIPVTTNEVTFSLVKENNEWQVKSQDKDMVDVVFPDLMNTIDELAEEYGEYGD